MPFSTSTHVPLTNEDEKIEKANLLTEVAILQSSIKELESHKQTLPDLTEKVNQKKTELAEVEKELAERLDTLLKRSIDLVVKDELHKTVSHDIETKTTAILDANKQKDELEKSIDQAKKDLSYLLEQQELAKKCLTDVQTKHEDELQAHETKQNLIKSDIESFHETIEKKQTELGAIIEQITLTSQLVKTAELTLKGLYDDQVSLNEVIDGLKTKKQSIEAEVVQKLADADKQAQLIIESAKQSMIVKEKDLAEREGLASLKEKWTKDAVAQGKAATAALENHYHLKSPIDLKWPV